MADKCPRCEHYTLVEAGVLESINRIVTYCQRCGFRGFKRPSSKKTGEKDE